MTCYGQEVKVVAFGEGYVEIRPICAEGSFITEKINQRR